ncbi:hypothetical protein BH18ACI1_BH18ACI1_24540 [soil metagenome]
MIIKRQYIIDEQNHKIAVQLDIKTFEQIEELLENYALYRLMDCYAPKRNLQIFSLKLDK